MRSGILAPGLVICAITELVAASPARMTVQSKTFMESRIREWVKLTAAHRAGEPDAAARTVSGWQASDLYDIFVELRQLQAFENKWAERNNFWSKEPSPTLKPDIVLLALDVRAGEVRSPVFTRLLFRAVLLHTDAAVLTAPVARSAGLPSPFTGLQMVLDRDGQQIGSGDVAWHLEFAAYLLDGIWPDVSTAERARAWYDAVAVHLLRGAGLGEADWLLGRGVARFPGDARLSFLRGTIDERYAMPPHQLARAGTNVMAAEIHLNRASGSFERAIALDPDLAEARLHAGRVASLLARHDLAADRLRRVTDAVRDPVLQYYASLFLGVEQEQSGDVAGARASYDLANHLFPQAPSPLLALSAVARRQGDSVEALAFVRRLLELPKQTGRQEDDPWWWYERSHVRDADQRLADWRARLSDGALR